MGIKFSDIMGGSPQAPAVKVKPTRGFFTGPPVGDSKDLQRILSVPRRNIDVTDTSMAVKWTAVLSRARPECTCHEKYGFCIKSLNAAQGWALEEANKAEGLLAPIGVGHGKTGIDILLPMVMNCKRAVLLIPANLRHQFLTRDYPQWAEHFRVPNIAGDGLFDPSRPVLHVLSYNELSQAKNSDILTRIQPDLIIADEAHNLKAKDRARTKRFLRQFAAASGTRFVALSGTMTTRSVKDYAHLSGLALKEATPLPVHFPTLESWATALDAVELPAPPGALEALCRPGEDVRSGFRRRLIETLGVVATEEASVGCSLVINERKVKPPKDIDDKLKFIRDQEARPDGEELIDQMQVASVARQMACGFFYRWQFRKGETPEQIERWLDVRSKWRKELRTKLKTGGVGTDSEALLQAAASRWHDGYTHEGKDYAPRLKSGPLPVWPSVHYKDWCEVRGTVEPHTVPVWVDDYLLNDAIEWAKTHVGIIWYQHRAVGQRLAQLSGLPHYGSGDEANEGIAREKGDRTVIASIKAHGVGKNLQAFNDQLIVSPPSDAAAWEQALGRTHRQGQKADEVLCDVYRHTPEMASAVDGAIMRARYIFETTGQKQRLLYASTTFSLDKIKVGA